MFQVSIEGHPNPECNGLFELESLTGSTEVLTSPVLKNKQSGMYLYQGPGQAGIDVGCTWILRNKLTPDEAFGEAFTRTKLGELPLGKREWRNGSGERCHVTMTQLVGAGKVVIKNAKRGKTVYKTEAEVQAALGPKHVGYYETQGGAFLRLQKGDQAWAARGAWRRRRRAARLGPRGPGGGALRGGPQPVGDRRYAERWGGRVLGPDDGA